jgi:hypothetical protein
VEGLYSRREQSVSTDFVSFEDDQLAEACQQALGIAPGAKARTRAGEEDAKRLGDSSGRCASRTTAVHELTSGDWVAAKVQTRRGLGEECLNVVATGSSVWRDRRAFETNPAKAVQIRGLQGDAVGSRSTRLMLRTRKDRIQILEEIKGAR